MSSRTQSGKTVSVAQNTENETADAGTERSAVSVEADSAVQNGGRRGNGTTNDHVTMEDTFTAPATATQRAGESGVGRDNIALDMREDDESGVTAPVAAQVDSDEILAQVGVTDGGQPTVTSAQRELDIETEQGENVVFMGDFDFAETDEDPYDWTCAIDDESRTLEQEERATGVAEEFDRHHERAHAAHERGEVPEQANAEANRRLARSWLEQSSSPPLGTNVEEVREQMTPREDPEAFVRRHVPTSLHAEVREAARRLSEKYETSGPEWSVAKRIVERIIDGESFDMAVFEERESIKNRRPIPGQRQFIEDVDHYSQWEATIEGEVTKAFDPNDPLSQQQVVIIEDETGTCKVTVWNNSFKDTVLHEGDRVRITDGEPGRYNGQLTLAVSGRTEMWVREEGEGRGPRGTKLYNPPSFDEPKMTEIHRRRTYRHRNPERRFSANPNKRFEKRTRTISDWSSLSSDSK